MRAPVCVCVRVTCSRQIAKSTSTWMEEGGGGGGGGGKRM